ncbi:hypothetical protein SDC9_152534 [bioreactor metagenome]|uniref:Flippase-like domain-containing protein n=1 Tax=bioreactor metagenome TaxID=1076179 RepID=A0A645EXY1_9ZZZZ
MLASSGVAARLEIASWMESLIKFSGIAILLFFAALFVLSFRESLSKGSRKEKVSKNLSGEPLNKIREFASTFVHQMSVVAVRPGAFLAVVASSLIIWGMDIFTSILVLRAFPAAGVDISSTFTISLVFLAVALGTIAKTFPITPGAIGTYEVALTGVFVLGGIRPELAFTVAVLDHIIKNSITLLGGGLALSELGLRWREVLSTNTDTLKGM